MTTQHIIKTLQNEKQEKVPSRFHCRAILVDTVDQYCHLISDLKQVMGVRVIQSSEIFSSIDTMPQYDNLTDVRYYDEWVILTGVSEYLKLFSKKESEDHRFSSLWNYHFPATSTGRIIVPLWGCKAQWFDASISLNSDLRQKEFFFDCSNGDAPDTEENVLVLSNAFEQYVSRIEHIQSVLKIGLREWFEYWENPSSENKDFILLTKRFRSISKSNGSVSIRIIPDILTYLQQNMSGGYLLTEEICNQEMQHLLFDYALRGISLDEAILGILNVASFSGVDIMGKWNTMSAGVQGLVNLWLTIHPDDSYLCHCFDRANGIENVIDVIGHEIFCVRKNKPEWVKEYNDISKLLAIKPDAQFYASLDEIPEYDIRLDFLTEGSKEERQYVLNMVGKWMKKDPVQVANCDKLRKVYPALYSYLFYSASAIPNDLESYFTTYKSLKLGNTLPKDEDAFFNGIQTDSYDYRFSVLSDSIDDDTEIIWVDALGIEWMSLLEWVIKREADLKITNASVALANLPTETCFNAQWNSMKVPYVKLDKLDKLAHKGVIDEPDYYSCIEEQIGFIVNLGSLILSKTKKHHRIIITGDHGTSRLAARFFHNRDGIYAPKGATIFSHGRYCLLPDGTSCVIPNTRLCKVDGKAYLVFENYDHFRQSGFAAGADDENAIYGEVHGGASPEEILIPVIVVENKTTAPITAQWKMSNNTTRIKMKKAICPIRFSQPVTSVQATIGNNEAVCTSDRSPSKEWILEFRNVKPAHACQVSLIADNHFIDVESISIESALGGGNDPF